MNTVQRDTAYLSPHSCNFESGPNSDEPLCRTKLFGWDLRAEQKFFPLYRLIGPVSYFEMSQKLNKREVVEVEHKY